MSFSFVGANEIKEHKCACLHFYFDSRYVLFHHVYTMHRIICTKQNISKQTGDARLELNA